MRALIANNWPMMAAMVLYTIQSVLSLRSGNVGIGIAFIFYALANVGLMLANKP
jgi:hypothetical protein